VAAQDFELVEIQFIPYDVLQPVFGTVGALIALVSLAPSVRRYAGIVPRGPSRPRP
jgi:hypothetical protein